METLIITFFNNLKYLPLFYFGFYFMIFSFIIYFIAKGR